MSEPKTRVQDSVRPVPPASASPATVETPPARQAIVPETNYNPFDRHPAGRSAAPASAPASAPAPKTAPKTQTFGFNGFPVGDTPNGAHLTHNAPAVTANKIERA